MSSSLSTFLPVNFFNFKKRRNMSNEESQSPISAFIRNIYKPIAEMVPALRSEDLVVTLLAAPTSSTLSYTVGSGENAVTRKFKVGQFARVLANGGWDMYQLYDVNNGVAVWKNMETSRDHEQVYINVTVDNDAPQGTTASGLVINAYYNGASVPTAQVTTDNNGMAALSVPIGFSYRLAFPTQGGCSSITDVVHVAQLTHRSVEVVYREPDASEGETVKVVIEQKTGNVLSRVSGVQVVVAYDNYSATYETDSDGTAQFVVPYGKQYTITAPQRQDWYLHGSKYVTKLTARESSRVVTYMYLSYESGLYVVASDGTEYLLDAWEAAVESGARQNSEAMLIKISSGQLSQYGGVFAIDIDMVRERTQGANQKWASKNQLFNSIPDNGNNASAAYYYDGLTASTLIQEEGNDSDIDTPAVDQCLAMSRVVAAGTVNELTLPGFLGSIGQWNELWKNVAEIDEILLSTRPNGTYLMSTWTVQKWSSTQGNASGAWYWTSVSAYLNGKNTAYVVLPFFAC